MKVELNGVVFYYDEENATCTKERIVIEPASKYESNLIKRIFIERNCNCEICDNLKQEDTLSKTSLKKTLTAEELISDVSLVIERIDKMLQLKESGKSYL